jgi:hypothetical protein
MAQCGLPSVIRNFSGAITAHAEGEAIISVFFCCYQSRQEKLVLLQSIPSRIKAR